MLLLHNVTVDVLSWCQVVMMMQVLVMMAR
jgi:hypothetical protein